MVLFRNLLNFFACLWDVAEARERLRQDTVKAKKLHRDTLVEIEKFRSEVHGQEVFVPISKTYNYVSDPEFLKHIGNMYHDDKFLFFVAMLRERTVILMTKSPRDTLDRLAGVVSAYDMLLDEVKDALRRYAVEAGVREKLS